MGERKRCWLDVVLSVLVWMGDVVANDPIFASTVFGIILGYFLFRQVRTINNTTLILYWDLRNVYVGIQEP